MVFDTDVLIWIERGNLKAARHLDAAETRAISLQTYLELLQCAKDKQQQKRAKAFIRDLQIEVLPLTENIGHRASVYIDQYSLSHGLRAGDALIAATAVENNRVLCSSNIKHYQFIPDLEFQPLRV
ncbi:type II toxin-antitoxin system VapC family toxin [Coraliomargarita algicola]|uniref:Ribonuclease VapC n=1 Tax=Coraliomargarita algicola TaxID=3092156 RepID=A0ABZ0RQ95_9BACT|nr:type II toxin-antitoxin system VapC family toxin [Coraliomargarita sp. J2-16]WPJ97563.1 type II toxin-antitoxin system VapC family toxin [Coraliomargarita sp. J2-16]